MKAILGKKIGMTRVFNEIGEIVPVTLIEAGPCFVTQIKKSEKEGYNAVQIGYGSSKNIKKPNLGHLKKANKNLASLKLKYLKEIRLDNLENIKEGQEVKVDVFQKGDKVDITSKSKGRGFAGVIKRHGFHGAPKTHGRKHDHRKPGAIGSGFPEHVIKGLRMAGRMGGEPVTLLNSEIFNIDKERNLIILKGAVPGARNSLVLIKAIK